MQIWPENIFTQNSSIVFPNLGLPSIIQTETRGLKLSACHKQLERTNYLTSLSQWWFHFHFYLLPQMVMKGNQNNLDQRKDILDIKDRSILSPQLSSFWLSRHCLLQSRYLRTTWIATAIESNTKVCTMFGGRRGGWTLRRVGLGLGQRSLCLLFWCCYLLKLLQLQQQCRAISNWWLQSISNKIFKNAILLLHHQHSSVPVDHG